MSSAVSLHQDLLRVRFADGHHADFHLRWLRHNCDADRHPATRERIVDSSELPEALSVATVAIDADVLAVTWTHDRRESRYPLGWLAEHAYASDREAPPAPPNDLAAITLEAAGLSLSMIVDNALARVATHGAVVVRADPADRTAPEDRTEPLVDAFAAAGLSAIPTHFGRIEDLRTDNSTNQNTDQLGYTDAAVDLHTDQPFLERPPRLQLLQSIRAAELGGENAVADALAAARWLRETDRASYELLTSTPVRFHRKQKAFEALVVSPILVDEPGRFQVRSSYFTMAPHRLPFADMEAWYRAHDRFVRLVRNPAHHYAFALRPGDFLLYDNYRMLHARTAFRGARWVRGIYFDRA